MLLGEALIKAGLITEAHLNKALQAQTRYPTLSIGEVITKLFAVPRDEVETHYLNLSIIPFVKSWLLDQLNRTMFKNGVRVGSTIADIDITVPSFTRYEGEAVSYTRSDNGMYQEQSSLTRMERVLLIVDPLVLTTSHHQRLVFNTVNLEVSLDKEGKGVRPDNPGFLSEVKLRLLKAYKELD